MGAPRKEQTTMLKAECLDCAWRYSVTALISGRANLVSNAARFHADEHQHQVEFIRRTVYVPKTQN